MDRELKFIVPPGIGDISWIYSKLLCLERPLEIVVARSNHDRAVPYLSLLPGVAHAEYAPVANPAKVQAGKAAADWTRARLVEEATRRALPIEMNAWLEAGNRIEGFMPELRTEHHYTIGVSPLNVYQVDRALGDWKRFICLYCANQSTVKRWGGWTPEQWAGLAELLWGAFDPDGPPGHPQMTQIAQRTDRGQVDAKTLVSGGSRPLSVPSVKSADLDGFVLLGADWDRPFADEVVKRIGRPLRDLVGKLPIGASLEVVRRGLYLVAFPSGIPILAAVLERPVLMFYSKSLEAMHDAWADPQMIESGAYKAMQFCPPEQAFEWIRDGYCLAEKGAF